MIKWIFSMSFAIAVFPAVSSACPKFFHSFNVPGTAVEQASLTFTENEFGPQLDGLQFKVGAKVAHSVFFGGRKKVWCAVLKDKTEGTSLDCGFLNNAQAGVKGSRNMIWVTTGKGKISKPSAFAIHTDDHTLTIYTLDPAKPLNKKDPFASVDSTKPELVVKGYVTVTEKHEATAKLEVVAWDAAANQSLGKAVHTVEGMYNAASAQINRPAIRESGPPPPIKPLTPFNLIGSAYTGPVRCGFGEISKYTPPSEDGKDRVPAKTN